MLFNIGRIKQEKSTCLWIDLVEEYRRKEEYNQSQSKVSSSRCSWQQQDGRVRTAVGGKLGCDGCSWPHWAPSSAICSPLWLVGLPVRHFGESVLVCVCVNCVVAAAATLCQWWLAPLWPVSAAFSRPPSLPLCLLSSSCAPPFYFPTAPTAFHPELHEAVRCPER
jgi:hypothetical protein